METIKVSDYIVEFLVKNNVKDVFGYPGGMVTHLMDSLEKNKKIINNHLCYNEQAAAFAACSNSQISNNIGVAYTTSGPGATNLITGISQAYFDSIPTFLLQVKLIQMSQRLDLALDKEAFRKQTSFQLFLRLQNMQSLLMMQKILDSI